MPIKELISRSTKKASKAKAVSTPLDMDGAFLKLSRRLAEPNRLAGSKRLIGKDMVTVGETEASIHGHSKSGALNPELEINRLLANAKLQFEGGMLALRGAAEDMATAQEYGASQRRIAELVGMSVGWVNNILKWRNEGYITPSPFQKYRGLPKLVQPAEHAVKAVSDRGIANPQSSQAMERISKADTANEHRTPVSQQSDVAGEEQANFASKERAILIDRLELLALAKPNLKKRFAESLECHRASIGMTWDQLLIPAQPTHK